MQREQDLTAERSCGSGSAQSPFVSASLCRLCLQTPFAVQQCRTAVLVLQVRGSCLPSRGESSSKERGSVQSTSSSRSRSRSRPDRRPLSLSRSCVCAADQQRGAGAARIERRDKVYPSAPVARVALHGTPPPLVHAVHAMVPLPAPRALCLPGLLSVPLPPL